MESVEGPNDRGVLWRLAAMMGILFMPISCWYVTVAMFIRANTVPDGAGMFSPGFVGHAYSTTAIGAMITPLVFGTIADKWFSADRLMAWLQLACSGLLFLLATVTSQTAFWVTMLVYALCFSPGIGLSNSICFRHLKNSDRVFPRLRALGTFSWVLGGWLIGYILPAVLGHSVESTTVPMKVGAVLHLVAAAACFTLPRTPPLATSGSSSWRSLMGGEAIAAAFKSGLLGPAVALTVLAIGMQFYTNFANLMLNDRGVTGAVGHMAWGQVVEIGVVLMLPVAFSKFGIQRTILIGTFCWVVRYVLLALAGVDGSPVLLWAAILMHGICYAFPFISLQVQADRLVAEDHRSAVQGLMTMMVNGGGALIGAQLCSLCQVRYLPGGEQPNRWQSVWIIAAFVSSIAFAMLLRKSQKERRQQNGAVTVEARI